MSEQWSIHMSDYDPDENYLPPPTKCGECGAPMGREPGTDFTVCTVDREHVTEFWT